MRQKIFLYILTWLAISQSYAQTGPAGVGTNDGSSALKLWLDAGRKTYTDSLGKQPATGGFDRIYLWGDLSGSGNDVKAYFDSTRPTVANNNSLLNGQNTLRFTRNDNTGLNNRNYLVSKSFPKTNDITIYCVFYPLPGAGGNNITPFKSKFISPNFWYYGAGLVDAGVAGPFNDMSMTICDSTLAAGGGDTTTFTDYVVKTPLGPIQKAHFGVLQKEAWSGVLSIGIDGYQAASYLASKQPINNSSKYYIGATSDINSPSENTFLDGYMASVLVYNRILNQVEKAILENYLSAKYGIDMPANDFFKMDQASYGNYDFDMAGIGKGTDASAQLSAKGEGLVEIGNATQLGISEYLLWAHNGLSTTMQRADVPDGVASKLERSWRVSEIGDVGNVDLSIDANGFADGTQKDLVLLIDTDNDGQFSDESLGKGIVLYSTSLNDGRYTFKGIGFKDAQRFTFGMLDTACKTDCDAMFSPNGDGQNDVYYLDYTGKTLIYDKYGNVVKEFYQPIYWDGLKSNGELANPGLYFVVSSNGAQSTVTVIR